jgi:hypothetical protein
VLHGIDPDRDGYMPHARQAPAVSVTGHDAQRIAALWRALPPGEQYRCHAPPFGLRFLRTGRLIDEASVCWQCNNLWGRRPGGRWYYPFDAKHPASQELLRTCERLAGFDARQRDAYTFQLSWRWTQPTHAVLPPDVMARIRPLNAPRLPPGIERFGLDPGLYENLQQARAAGPPEDASRWLRQLPVEPDERVVLNWIAYDLAVETDWDLFTRHWDDFCYPSSDDVAIYPFTGTWVLFYMHDEVFTWGRQNTARSR